MVIISLVKNNRNEGEQQWIGSECAGGRPALRIRKQKRTSIRRSSKLLD